MSSTIFERILLLALRRHALLGPDESLPACIEEAVAQLPYYEAVELLRATICEDPRFIELALIYIIKKLRYDARCLLPILFEQLELDSLITTAADSTFPAALPQLTAAISLLQQAQAAAPLDPYDPSTFHAWLADTLAHARHADANGLHYPAVVRNNLLRFLQEAPLLLTLRAFTTLRTTRLGTDLQPLHTTLQHRLVSLIEGRSQEAAGHIPETPTGLTRLLLLHLLPSLGPKPYTLDLLQALSLLYEPLPLPELHAQMPAINALHQPDLDEAVTEILQRKVEAFALSIPLYVSPSYFDNRLLVLLTYAQHLPNNSLSAHASRAIANYARQLTPDTSLGLLAWAADTQHYALTRTLHDIHINRHRRHPELLSARYDTQARSLSSTRQLAFHDHVLAAAEAPADDISNSISAALAAIGRPPYTASHPEDSPPPASPTCSVPSLYYPSSSNNSEDGSGASEPLPVVVSIPCPYFPPPPRATFVYNASQLGFLGFRPHSASDSSCSCSW